MGAVDVPALLLAVVLSAVITAALALFADKGTHRDWAAAGAIALAVFAIGMIDLMRETPRETFWATWIFGAAVPVAAATGVLHSTRSMRPWIRYPVVFLLTVVMLFGGLLIGATLVTRFLG
jgi:hypothetical protein